MPTVNGASKATSDAGKPAKMSAGKTSNDLVKSLEVAILQFKGDRCEKNMTNIDKIIQVFLKMSDLETLANSGQALIDLKWLLTLPTPASSAINLFLKLVICVPRIRPIIRDKLHLVATITQILLNISDGSVSKIAKLLELLRQVVYGIQIERLEAYLQDLVPKLLGFICNGKDSNHLSHSLSILGCLCHRNYIVKKYVLAQLNEDVRKTIFTICSQDPKNQVLNDFLDYNLGSTNLSFSAVITASKIESRLPQLVALFCTTYSEDDCATMRIIIDFLNDLRQSSPETKYEYIVQMVHQVCIVADYSDGFNAQSNDLLFLFLRSLTQMATTFSSLTEIVTKTVALQLETKSIGIIQTVNAVKLLTDLMRGLVTEINDISSSDKQNIRLWLDSVTPLLCYVVSMDDLQTLNNEICNGVVAVIDALTSVVAAESWADLVSSHLPKPYTVIVNLNRLATLNYNICLAPIFSKLFKLGEMSTSLPWQSATNDLMSDKNVIKQLVNCLQKGCHTECLADTVQALSRSNKLQEEAMSPKQLFLAQHQLEDQRFSDYNVFEMSRLADVLDESFRMLKKVAPTEDIVCQTVELLELRTTSQMRQLESLKNSLKAADEQISCLSARNIQLECEVSRGDQLTSGLWRTISAQRREISDIKHQYSIMQEETSVFQQKAREDLATKSLELSKLTDSYDQLTRKIVHYKEQNTALQETIKEHQKIRTELEDKLKFEAKINQDLTITLTKREEKLRKKERQIEEDLVEREKLEKEVEKLNREMSSLQSLTKGQEQALAKKDKQLQDNQEELGELRRIHEQIFNLSKLRGSK